VPRRLDIGALLAAAGALLLIVSLFLDWYELAGDAAGVALTGWNAFELTDVVLTLIALGTLAAVAARFGFISGIPHRTLTVAGGAALLLVAVQLLNPPPVLSVVDESLATGAWLALSGAALMFAGGAFSLARISISLSFEERDREVAIRREQRAAAAPAPPAPEPPARDSETIPLDAEPRKD
jgi:hypothetical protein